MQMLILFGTCLRIMIRYANGQAPLVKVRTWKQIGPIRKKDYQIHEPMWTKSMKNIQSVAEN